jgi:hypothetical protein
MSAKENTDFGTLEGQLAATLKPVPPQQAFVQNVRQRISLAAAPAVAIRPGLEASSWLITLAELFSIFLLAAVVARVIWYLLSRFRSRQPS